MASIFPVYLMPCKISWLYVCGNMRCVVFVPHGASAWCCVDARRSTTLFSLDGRSLHSFWCDLTHVALIPFGTFVFQYLSSWMISESTVVAWLIDQGFPPSSLLNVLTAASLSQ